MASEEDERDEELSSIRAIFPELVVDSENPHTATLELEISPAISLPVTFRPIAMIKELAAYGQIGPPLQLEEPQSYSFDYLPPLCINIDLPDGYPSESPPKFIISTVPQWLPHDTLEHFKDYGKELWEEYGHSQVVYALIDRLQQEAESAFGLTNTNPELDLSLKDPMINHDKRARRQKFEQGTYDCGICLDPKKGSVCYQVNKCNHVFCKECLCDFFGSAIREGDISSVKCPDPDCGMEGLNAEQRRAKVPRNLQPSELLEIPIPREQVQRYADLKVKKILESDKHVIYCPRSWCQAPARNPWYARLMACAQSLSDFPEVDAEVKVRGEDAPRRPLERLHVCSKCDFAFCRVCQKSWHGDFVRCSAKVRSDDLTEQEKASEEYLRLHTSACPTCSVPCQKIMGCNHMRCFQCHTHFCYLCQAWLDGSNPYSHFSDKQLECFMRLWDLEQGDDGTQAQGAMFWGGARAREHAQHAAAAAAARQAEGGDGDVVEVVRPAEHEADRGGGGGGAAQEQNRGLRRFLEMAANDEEDGWESDELEDDMDAEFLLMD